MSYDPTNLPACTIEDGSLPGQAFPCYWDAATSGNGQGTSFIMPALNTFLYADGRLECPDAQWANDTLDGCVPLPVAPTVLPEAAVSPANDQPAVPLTVEPVAQVQVPVQVPAAPASELAHTGADPVWWVAAALMVAVGATMVRVGRTHSS
jgi:hypothetical protein